MMKVVLLLAQNKWPEVYVSYNFGCVRDTWSERDTNFFIDFGEKEFSIPIHISVKEEVSI